MYTYQQLEYLNLEAQTLPKIRRPRKNQAPGRPWYKFCEPGVVKFPHILFAGLSRGESWRLPLCLIRWPSNVAEIRGDDESTRSKHHFTYIQYIYIYIYISLSISYIPIYLSLSLSIHIYIYICADKSRILARETS